MHSKNTAHFLLEIGTEEIPAGYFDGVLAQLKELDQHTGGQGLVTATPRRLVYFAQDIVLHSADREETVFGPPVAKAKTPDGQWTKAAEGFMRKMQVEPSQVMEQEKDPGSGKLYVCCKRVIKGRPASDELADLLPQLISNLSFPKSMRWIPSERFSFARPMRWIVALLGEEVVSFDVHGIRSGNTTRGHRFLAPGPCTIAQADFAAYQGVLQEHKVIVDRMARRDSIRDSLKNILCEIHQTENIDSTRLIDEDLVSQVADLVEYPLCVKGSFDASFLALPEEVLITSMKSHQKFFALRGKDGALTNMFVTFSNGIESPLVVKGNERVLRARLADADFFFKEDQKEPLYTHLERLKDVVYQAKLGSYFEKTLRVVYLARALGRSLSLEARELQEVERAAFLCKADLVTHMVGEFPTLQGVMGRYYAQICGETQEVALGILEHYRKYSPKRLS